MKKAFIYLFLGMIITLTACDPVESRDDMGGPVLTASEVDATATPIVVNGQNSNKVIVKNNSPILCRWTLDGVVQSAKSTDTLTIGSTGLQTIVFEGYNPDGTLIYKDLPVTIDELIY